MSLTGRARHRMLILSLVLGGTIAAHSQVQPPSRQSVAENKAEEEKYYADAHPYLDQPISQLKKTVDLLQGLKPAPDQDQLSALLTKLAAETDEALPKIPNLLADEAVTETARASSQRPVPSCLAGCLDAASSLQRDLKFNYIILAHPAQSHVVLLEEYRTSRDGKPVEGADAPHFQGFASLWAFFSSSDQVELRFRYLGQQKMDGHPAFVIGFAQIPGSIEYPAMIVTPRGTIPMLLQGIAWIDQADYRIIRLHADLLAPQPNFNYLKQTFDIEFGTARIPALSLDLWLPRSVDVATEAESQIWREQHRYSKYRLYQAKSKIILSPTN